MVRRCWRARAELDCRGRGLAGSKFTHLGPGSRTRSGSESRRSPGTARSRAVPAAPGLGQQHAALDSEPPNRSSYHPRPAPAGSTRTPGLSYPRARLRKCPGGGAHTRGGATARDPAAAPGFEYRKCLNTRGPPISGSSLLFPVTGIFILFENRNLWRYK